MNWIVRFLKDDTGVTAIEYALIAASMGITLVGAIPLLGSAVTSSFSTIAEHITSGK